jgi:hypothetical protein
MRGAEITVFKKCDCIRAFMGFTNDIDDTKSTCNWNASGLLLGEEASDEYEQVGHE